MLAKVEPRQDQAEITRQEKILPIVFLDAVSLLLEGRKVGGSILIQTEVVYS